MRDSVFYSEGGNISFLTELNLSDDENHSVLFELLVAFHVKYLYGICTKVAKKEEM